MGGPDLQRPSAFVRDGFAVLDGFVGEGEIAELRALVQAVVVSAPASACSRPHNTLLPLRWNDGVVRFLLACRQRVDRLARAVAADDLRWISGYVSIKEAGSRPLGWHQDWWCWDHPASFRPPAPQVAVLCYPTATAAHNGALRVLPGSHRKSLEIHAHLPEPHGPEARGVDPGHVAARDHPDQVTLSLDAGDAVVVDYRLLHGTHGNASRARRDCVLLSFTPSWRGLPADIRGHLIDHFALPSAAERPPPGSWEAELLPGFDGARQSLRVNRVPPGDFEIAG